MSRASEAQVSAAAAAGIQILSNMVAIARIDEHLRGLAALCNDDGVKPVPIRLMPLGDAVEAHRAIESGHARGKIVLEVADHAGW